MDRYTTINLTFTSKYVVSLPQHECYWNQLLAYATCIGTNYEENGRTNYHTYVVKTKYGNVFLNVGENPVGPMVPRSHVEKYYEKAFMAYHNGDITREQRIKKINTLLKNMTEKLFEKNNA